MRVEGDAVAEAADILRPVGLARRQRTVGAHAEARDAPRRRLGDVEEFLLRVEAQLVGAAQAVGDDARALVVDHGDVAVIAHDLDMPGPRHHARRHGQPQPASGIAGDEVRLADRLAVDAVEQRAGLTGTRRQLQRIGAEIGDEEIAVGVEGETVGKAALRVDVALLEGTRLVAGDGRLQDQLLRAVRVDADHAAAAVGAPQRAVALGQDAFGPLQPLADKTDPRAVDLPAGEWIGHARNGGFPVGCNGRRAAAAAAPQSLLGRPTKTSSQAVCQAGSLPGEGDQRSSA